MGLNPELAGTAGNAAFRFSVVRQDIYLLCPFLLCKPEDDQDVLAPAITALTIAPASSGRPRGCSFIPKKRSSRTDNSEELWEMSI